MDTEKLSGLLKYNTPSVTNAVATYPKSKDCLKLYDPWNGKWYTDQTLKCMFPELGPRAGHAVTCVYGLPEEGGAKLSIADLLAAIGESEKPVILAVKQDFPEDIKKIDGLMGGNMMTAFKSAGAVCVLTDGPSRDVDEVRTLGIQYMLTGVSPGHGDFALKAINVPVEICGMLVLPGEIIHMDEHGAVKFPPEYTDAVLEKLEAIERTEQKRQKLMRETTDPAELGRIMMGLYD